MGKQDIASNIFWKNPRRVADLLNVAVYNGAPVIQPRDVCEITPVVPRIWWHNEKLGAEFRIADARFRIKKHGWTANIFLQNQTDISYIMPVRGMDTDSTAYYNQWAALGMQHMSAKDLRSGGEFLSRFAKKDRLDGELTIVIYYGRKKWDGARRLKDLLPLALRRNRLQNFISDYSVNLVDVRRYPDTGRFQTDLRQVFHFLQKDNDRAQLRKYVHDNAAFFDNIAEDAYDLLAAVSDIRILRERKTLYQNQGRNTYQMCKAIEDWSKEERTLGRREGWRKGRAKGRAEGRVEGLTEGQEQLSNLGLRMKAENRVDDFFRSLSDTNYLHKLLREYGLAAK